jgi:hypothetical protein
MEIAFTKLSDLNHRITVWRADGSTETRELESRGPLQHDLAHFAVEIEVPIARGFWGCVAAGASLTGDGVGGPAARFAESLAGPIQVLLREQAQAGAYLKVLRTIAPNHAQTELAGRIHERVRQLRGHWKATAYGGDMLLSWRELVA